MSQLQDIKKIVGAQLSQEQNAAAELTRQIDALQNEINVIEEQSKLAFPTESSAFARQHVGADTLWLRHLAHRKAQLQTSMASLRAQQMMRHETLSKAFSQHSSLQTLVQNEIETSKRKADQRLHDEIQHLAMMTRTSNTIA